MKSGGKTLAQRAAQARTCAWVGAGGLMYARAAKGATPRAIVLTLLLAALTGCASVPKASGALTSVQIVAAEQQQAAREALLQRRTDWSLAGRIAVSTGQNGGSGRIEWSQAGQGYRVALSAPVTRRSWQLSVDARSGQARLEGLDGGPRTGPDAGLLLREATGWDIPVIALSDWVRGLRAPGLGAAAVEFDATLRPVRIAQAGWDITYIWPDTTGAGAAAGAVAGASANGAAAEPTLPARVEARRADARVRLVIDQWNPAPPQ